MSDKPRYTLKVNPWVSGLYCRIWDRMHPETRFIFFATTGRSGTGLFAHILGELPGCHAEHEPYPNMAGPPLETRNTGRSDLSDRHYEVRKAVNIRRLASTCRVYAETNHTFIRSFWEPALRDLDGRIQVVHLRRDPVAVAKSMVRLDAAPGSENGNWWYLDPAWQGHELAEVAILVSPGGEFDHPFYRSLWYWYEVEARIARVRQTVPDLPVRTLDWSGALDPKTVGALLEWLGLPTEADEVERLCHTRVNEQTDLTRKPVPAQGELEMMHAAFRKRLLEMGHIS